MKTKLITKEINLLEILKWEDDYDRDTVFFENGSTKFEIVFWKDHKVVHFKIDKLNSSLTLSTKKLSPKQIIKYIELIIKTLET